MLAALFGRRRGTALRAMADGLFVVWKLSRGGLRPLLTGLPALPDGDVREARCISEAVDAGLGALPVAATCLRRSMTLLRELRRHHMGATLHIGVRQGQNGVEAHAWVQIGDRIINDDPEIVGTYVPLSVGDAERLHARFD